MSYGDIAAAILSGRTTVRKEVARLCERFECRMSELPDVCAQRGLI